MGIYRYLAAACCLSVVPLLVTSFIVGQDTKKKIKNDVCSASNPASICAEANTCGSASSKNTGFVIDFGKDNPFDHEGSIIGGADRPITVTAKHPGCYTYSVGACTPGTVYGMCGNADTQLIISAN